MCTLIKSSQKNRPRTAKDDIIVFKRVVQITKDECESPFMGFTYEKGIEYTREFSYEKNDNVFDDEESRLKIHYRYKEIPFTHVVEGFHALTENNKDRLNRDVIAQFIIPKGAKYYVNDAKCIVSNKIIFKDYYW